MDNESGQGTSKLYYHAEGLLCCRPIFTAPRKLEEHLENTTNLKKNKIKMSWSQKYAT